MHIALFSGGLSSFEATRRMIFKYPDDSKIWFFNTRIEDKDTFRFIKDCENYFQRKIEIFSEGRNPWEVFRDERFIGNSYITPCNKILKRKFLEKILRSMNFVNKVYLIFGISILEKERIFKISEGWRRKGIETKFPLINSPIYHELTYEEFSKAYGIEPPRLYCMGFRHNNCGGACVKAGIKQWINLYNKFPERYLWHERQEIITRNYLGKNVSILRDRRNGITKPLTLEMLRKRFEYDMKEVENE